MTLVRPTVLAALLAVAPLPVLAQESSTVTVRDAYGQLVTTLTLSDAGNGVVVTGTLTGVDPGAHAIHFHEKGECEPPFETAGGHFNPTDKKHGILNQDGHHAGDMPNIVMPDEGEGIIQIFAEGVTLAEGEITAEPALSWHGWHIIRLDAIAEGAVLPYHAARGKIVDAMEKAAWVASARAFVSQLVASAEIAGADLRPA